MDSIGRPGKWGKDVFLYIFGADLLKFLEIIIRNSCVCLISCIQRMSVLHSQISMTLAFSNLLSTDHSVGTMHRFQTLFIWSALVFAKTLNPRWTACCWPALSRNATLGAQLQRGLICQHGSSLLSISRARADLLHMSLTRPSIYSQPFL